MDIYGKIKGFFVADNLLDEPGYETLIDSTPYTITAGFLILGGAASTGISLLATPACPLFLKGVAEGGLMTSVGAAMAGAKIGLSFAD